MNKVITLHFPAFIEIYDLNLSRKDVGRADYFLRDNGSARVCPRERGREREPERDSRECPLNKHRRTIPVIWYSIADLICKKESRLKRHEARHAMLTAEKERNREREMDRNERGVPLINHDSSLSINQCTQIKHRPHRNQHSEKTQRYCNSELIATNL